MFQPAKSDEIFLKVGTPKVGAGTLMQFFFFFKKKK